MSILLLLCVVAVLGLLAGAVSGSALIGVAAGIFFFVSGLAPVLLHGFIHGATDHNG